MPREENPENTILEMRGVRRFFPAAGEVLCGVDLSLGAGESLAVVGPSGCGKSTLLNLAGALDRPDAGAIRFEDRELQELTEPARAAFRNDCVGFVFQEHHLLPQCTVLENVLLPLLARRSAVDARACERAKALLDRVGLGARTDYRPGRLSGGERQRVAVVRALINRPRLLLADEPTGALDEDTAGQLAELLVELNREQGVSLIVVTHASSLAARMDRALRLHGGRLQAEVR